MLWVWGASGPAAAAQAATVPPQILRELEELAPGTRVYVAGKPYTRDLYYDFEMLVENFLDPAHVPFAHHGVIGDRFVTACGSSVLSV
jgi:pheophorbide a oxygenase